MAHVLIMPRQGNTVESCIIVRWTVAEGATIQADETVCEVETDKASFDVPAGASGVLLKVLRTEGDDVPVLEPIAVIGSAGEDWKKAIGGAADTAASAGGQSSDIGMSGGSAAGGQSSVSPAQAGGEGQTLSRSAAVSPRARKLAAAEGVEASFLEGTGPEGRVIERDVAAALAGRSPLTAAAKAAFTAAGGVLPAVAPGSAGSALGGRIGLADLAGGQSLGAVNSEALSPLSPTALRGAAKRAAPGEFPGPFVDTPLKGVRKLISERMRASLAGTAQLTFNSSASARQIQALRARFKASAGSEAAPSLGLSDVTIGDLVLYAVSRVLPRFPNANATLEDGVLRVYERVHLALAVDTQRGLMVPVIRNADLLSLREISAESKRLASACQAGNISPDELSGGTFTVSNLGALGIESFTPVLNAPQVAILGVDAIVPRPAYGPDGAVVIEQRMGLSITVDHQIIDGAPAARLLKAFADAIADIDLILMA